MSFAIRKLRLAEEDALDAAIWYEKRQAGLGEDFLSSQTGLGSLREHFPSVKTLGYSLSRKCDFFLIGENSHDSRLTFCRSSGVIRFRARLRRDK